MYGKMQESGLVEIFPLMCTSAIWGQHPVLFHQVSSGGITGGGCNGWLLDGGRPVSILSFLRAQHGGSCHVIAGWLQQPLFTDMAGNILHSHKIFKTCNVMTCIYTQRIPLIELTHPSLHIFTCVCVCVCEHLSSALLANFNDSVSGTFLDS